MTEKEEIARLDARVGKLEDDIWNELKGIRVTLTAIQVSQAGNHCPSPGKCLQLDTALGSAVLRIERLEMRLMELDQWRFKMLGGLGVLMVALTIFAPYIRKLLNLQ